MLVYGHGHLSFVFGHCKVDEVIKRAYLSDELTNGWHWISNYNHPWEMIGQLVQMAVVNI